MQLSTDHILTTHAGSLPRPDDVAQMLYAMSLLMKAAPAAWLDSVGAKKIFCNAG